MNDKDADRQISQMVEFIKQEAKEKAEEVEVKTESEFNAKKLTKIQQARTEILAEMAKRKKEFGSQKRIARSRLVTGKRFQTMENRDALLAELREKVKARLADVSGHKQYSELVRALLIEAFCTVLEDRVEVLCREADDATVRAELPGAVKAYKELVKKECGVEPRLEATLSSQRLAPPPSKGSQGVTCAGGVVVTARGGKVVCRNTLDARFDLAYAQLLPVTRQILFGERAGGKKLA